MWQEAAAIAGIGAFGATLVLAAVTWVQGKQAAFRDLATFYHAYSARVLFPMRKYLAQCSEETTIVLGLPGHFIGGGPIGEWWPELEEKEPGLVNQLPRSLRDAMQDFQTTAAQFDIQHRTTWRTLYGLVTQQADPAQELRQAPDDLMEIRLDPPGMAGVRLEELWIRRISLQDWVRETAASHGGRTSGISLGMKGKVVAEGDKAYEIVDQAVSGADDHPDLLKTRRLAEQGAQLARKAMGLLEAEMGKKPQRRFLWPRLADDA